jgi:tetratricopeptide (TPR) repeat protein
MDTGPTGEFSVKDVARLFDLQEARLRYWAQTGFVGPSVRKGGRFFYTFQDLIGIKVAKELLDAGLSLQTVRKNLESLRAALPHVDRPLTQLRVTADGDRVVVTGDDAPFEAHSGQVVMSFTVSALSQQAAAIVPLAAPAPAVAAPPADATTAPPAATAPPVAAAAAPAPRSGYAEFLAGVAAQDAGDLSRAEAAYRRAVALDPALAAAWTNLASLLEKNGHRGEAREAIEKAVALDPEQPEARYNLANLLADAGEDELAAAEYRRVLALCPEFADAHFNLALLLARSDARALARVHLERYLDLDADSAWADRARAHLAELGSVAAAARTT